MKFQYREALIISRTPSEIIAQIKLHSQVDCLSDVFDYLKYTSLHPSYLVKKLIEKHDLIPLSNNIYVVDFLTSCFDVPTMNNFANRSAIELCKQFTPSEYYDAKFSPSMSDYLISLFMAMTWHITREFIRKHSHEVIANLTSGKLFNIDDLRICETPIFKEVPKTLSYKRDISYYTQCAKWCDAITRSNIKRHFISRGILNPHSLFLSDLVQDELNLFDPDFICSIIKRILPKSNLEYLLICYGMK